MTNNGDSLKVYLMGLPHTAAGIDHKLNESVKIKLSWASTQVTSGIKTDTFNIDLICTNCCFGLDEQGHQRSKPWWSVLAWEVVKE